jgi:hypothetical protein
VEGGSHVHETELLAARKLRIIEKKIIAERGNILTVFIRRLLKMSLMLIRTSKKYREAATPQLIYCIVQVCYEIGNVEEESQISAFNQLLLSEVKKVNKSMEELQ